MVESERPLHPYHDALSLPRPPDMDCPYNVQWVEIDLGEEDVGSYPYRVQAGTRIARGKTAISGTTRNAVVFAPIGPGERRMMSGDIWVKTEEPFSVLVFIRDGVWVDWMGNDYAQRTPHPILPNRRLWFSFEQEFAWIKKSGVSSKRAQWRSLDQASAAYMTRCGRLGVKGEPAQANVEDVIAILKIPVGERRKFKRARAAGDSPQGKKQRAETLARTELDIAMEHLQVVAVAEDINSTGESSLSPCRSESYLETDEPVGCSLSPCRSESCLETDEPVRCSLESEPPRSTGEEKNESGSQSAQSVVNTTSLHRLWDGIDKRQWPESASHLTWTNGMTTVAPYVGALLGKDDDDLEAVRRMSKAWDARIGDENLSSPVVFLQWDPARHHALSHNVAVIVEGWSFEGEPILYDDEGLTRLRGSLLVPVQYHCAAKRIHSRTSRNKKGGPHVDATLEEFLRLSRTEEACGNLMDSPQVDDCAPTFVRSLADDRWAWKVTAREGYEKEGLSLQKLTLKDTQKARSDAMQIAKDADRDPVPDDVGPRVATVDSFHFRHWDLVTMSGFYTWPHHDANGLCTWGSVRDGAKMWGMIRFRAEKFATCAARVDMFRLFERALTNGGKGKYETDEYEIFVIVLEKGSTIIMPPGAWHEVYTPVNTIITGGHFLSYNTLHLTQWSRLYDHWDRYGTNADHVGFRRTLARMTLGLRYLQEPLRKRPFLALASMIRDESRYRPAGGQKEAPGSKYEDDIEMVVAYRIIQVVCKFNDIEFDKVDEGSVLIGESWANPGDDIVRLDCLRVGK
ncbi:hypothetical protein BV25DRAFT_1838261 [Artomyces pyxidatus]|uniref:Uncharacterized protein n=1 Tax=Artomyces pyxidatus TaxID=48021 RepID=A0ACB8T142_9AGAM|nr:hypothetical protein BV25DRAFT_1838261 [Artomyces pyxidatus]